MIISNTKKVRLLLMLIFIFQSCGIYNFTGGNIGTAKTFKVDYFKNYAAQNLGSTIEPGLDRDFTIALQDLIQNQTSLDYTTASSDLLYEGEITEYRVSPMTATANQTAAQNRLTIGVKVRFFNNTKEDSDFERSFSFYYDYPANQLLHSVKNTAHKVIFERLTQDIFNASLADW